MNEHIQELIEHTKIACGLDAFTLKTQHIFYDERGGYIFSMEWFPNDAEVTEDDLNPPGTAIIDIDFHSKTLRRFILAEGVSYITEGTFPSNDRDQLLDWIEEETDMTYGRQFQLIKEEKSRLEFRASIDNLPVEPSGKIEVEFNEKGELALFSVIGLFPNEEDMAWEPFSLTPEDTEPFIRSSLSLIDIPVEKEIAWVPIYKIEEQYITNDGKTSIPTHNVNEHPVYLAEDHVLKWKGKGSSKISKQKIDTFIEATFEEAINKAEHADRKPISEQLEQKCLEEAARAMQFEYPDESGRWKVTNLYRDRGYIFAVIRPFDKRAAALRKVTLIFNEEGKAINIVDNKFIFQLLESFEKADNPKITADEAYKLLKEYVEIEPVYVLDRNTGKYHIHGSLHSPFAVNAITGELLKTKDIL